MEYKVVTAGAGKIESAALMLKERVETEIRESWKPLGGVSAGPMDRLNDQPFFYLLQAMIKG